MKISIGKAKKSKEKTGVVIEPKGKKKKLGRRVSVETEKKAARSLGRSGKPKFTRTSSQAAQRALEEEMAGEFWKPKTGKNSIVMLPSLEEWGSKYPWVETGGHYVGGKDVLAALGIDKRPDELPMVVGCAKFHDKRPCELDAFVNKLFKSRHARDKKLASALKLSFNAYANIVDLASPKLARPFRFGKTIRNQLLATIENGDHFYDPDALLLITIRKIKKGKQIWEVDYDVRVQAKRVVGKLKKRWYKTMSDLSTYAAGVPDPDEVQEIIDILIAASEGDDDDEVGLDDGDFDDTDDIPF